MTIQERMASLLSVSGADVLFDYLDDEIKKAQMFFENRDIEPEYVRGLITALRNMRDNLAKAPDISKHLNRGNS